jgi:hypothetical protein
LIKKLFGFLFSVLLILCAIAVAYFAAQMFDMTRRVSVSPQILLTDDVSDNRTSKPIAFDDLPDEFVRDILIRRFMTEYFGVLPGERLMAQTANGILRGMASASALEYRAENIELELLELAAARAMRRVTVTGPVVTDGDWLRVKFDEITWKRPNEIWNPPTLRTGREVMLRVRFDKSLREIRGDKPFDAGAFMTDGGDPAAVFRFIVEEVRL